MNSLSWLLYAANTLDNLGTAMMAIGAIIASGLALGHVFRAIVAAADDKAIPAFPLKHLGIACVMIIVACFMPAAKTVYMIAASEAGARVADTAEGREILDLLRQRIRDALSDTKKT